MQRKLKFPKITSYIIFWTIVIVSFVFFAFLIIMKANGYQINFRQWKIVKTAMIILDGQPKDVTIMFNKKKIDRGFPCRISNLMPGNYEIIIFLSDYQVWQKTINLEPGKAISFNNIILFLRNARDSSKINDISSEKIVQEFQDNSQNLELKDTEIYFDNKLITRFTTKILAASFYTDRDHIVFQQGNEVRVMDRDGSNNIHLFSLSSYEPTVFTFRDNGTTIIFLDEGLIKAKIIR